MGLSGLDTLDPLIYNSGDRRNAAILIGFSKGETIGNFEFLQRLIRLAAKQFESMDVVFLVVAAEDEGAPIAVEFDEVTPTLHGNGTEADLDGNLIREF